jgi:hypothetical protein
LFTNFEETVAKLRIHRAILLVEDFKIHCNTPDAMRYASSGQFGLRDNKQNGAGGQATAARKLQKGNFAMKI